MTEKNKVDEDYCKWAKELFTFINDYKGNNLIQELAMKLQDDVEEFTLFWYCDECERIHPDNIGEYLEPRYNEGYL